jgi:hypothetical protein
LRKCGQASIGSAAAGIEALETMNIAENMMGTIRRVTRNVKTSVLVVVDSFFHAISYFKDEAAWRSTHATAYERQSRMT